jgi:hypothetical protein
MRAQAAIYAVLISFSFLLSRKHMFFPGAFNQKLEHVVDPNQEAIGSESSRRIGGLLPAPLILKHRFDICANQ